MSEPAWVEHSIWWHVYPLGFLGADTTGADRQAHRTLRDLIPWLDYLLDVGLNGLALGPIFASETHGYDTLDYFRIDERLGDEADFEALVRACQERGIRVMLDGVFNHVAPGYPGLERLRSDSVFEGHEQLIELDHDKAEVRDLVTSVMTHWCERGVDAWRLDAAYRVPPQFWQGVLPRVRQAHPQVYVMGELLHGDYAQIVRAAGFDSCTQYELWKALWSSLDDGNFFELDWTLQRQAQMMATFVPWTFLGNHDVTRIASQLSTPDLLPAALVLLLTLPGTPAIYYGDEQAFRGVKYEREGGDDEIRPAFPGAPDELSDLGQPVLHLTQQLIGLRRRYPWLHAGQVSVTTLRNEQFAYRVQHEDELLVVAVNIGSQAAELELGDGGPWTAVAGDARPAEGERLDGERVELGSRGWVVLVPATDR